MDHRGALLLASLIFVYALNVYAAIKPVCQGISPQDDYEFLRHLYMGYVNPKPESSEDLAGTVEVIKKITLCGIQTICLSILRMTVPTSTFDAQIRKVIISRFEKIPRDAMVILYSINTEYENRVLYSLWLFCLYIKDVEWYWAKLNAQQMDKVHEMVTEQLTKSMMNDCTGHNEFDVTDRDFRFSSEFAESSVDDPTLISNRIKNRFDNVRPTLEKLAGEQYKRIDVNNLLFNTVTFSMVYDQVHLYEHVFGKSIKWGTPIVELWKAYKMAKDPVNLYTELQGIRDYQFLYLTMLKMAMLRMIWLYLLVITDENGPQGNDAMWKTANDFGVVTGLNDDKAFVEAVDFLRVESLSPKGCKEAMDYIGTELTKSCLSFKGCEILIVDKSDVSWYTSNPDLYKDTSTDVQRIHKLAEHFARHVKDSWLEYVDQDFVKSVLALAHKIPVNY